MVPAWLAALVVAYLPGALLMRVPLFNRPLRATLDAEERVYWGLVLSIAWSLLVTLGLAMANRYSFDRLIVVSTSVSAAILLIWRTKLRYDAGVRPVTATALVPAAVVALGLWLYFPPAEYVMGGKDPGVYLNEGVQIAQQGRLVSRDSTVAEVPAALRGLFFPQHRDPSYYGLRFMGFFVVDPDAGTVVGQFPHLFPASIAIGYGLNGLSGARQTIGLWAILGLLGVYLLTTRMFGRAAAAGATGLLAINIVEIWFARYPNSEMPMQALLFAALLAASRALDGGRAFFGSLAGLLLSLMLFLRFDVVLAGASFAAAAMLSPLARGRLGTGFALALILVGLFGVAYLVGPMQAYARYPLAYASTNGVWWLVGAAALLAWGCRLGLGWRPVARVLTRALPITIAGTLAVLAIYAYFFRQSVGRLALGDAMAFRAFGWFVTPAVLGIAVTSACYFLARRFWREPAFYATFTTFAVFFFYKTRIVPEYLWTTRRFLAITLPATFMFVAAAADLIVGRRTLSGLVSRLRADATNAEDHAHTQRGAVLTLAVLAPVAVVFWQASQPVIHHVEYAGLIPRLEQMAAAVGTNDLLIVESRNAGSDLHALALPLAHIYARHVLVLDTAAPPRALFEQFVLWALSRYDHVLFLGGGGTDLLARGIAAVPVANDRFQVPEYATPTNAYPLGTRQKEFEYGLYRLVPAPHTEPGPIELTVGVLDDLNVVRFFAREKRADGTPFRWSGAQSFVVLQGIAPSARRVTIWMSDGGRPRQAPPAALEVALNDYVLGTATAEDRLRSYDFPLPAALAASIAEAGEPARLRLRVATWNPAAVVGGNDTRDLGVMLTRVEVK